MSKILYHHRIASKDGQSIHVEAIVNSLKKEGHTVLVCGPSLPEKLDTIKSSEDTFIAKLKVKLPVVVYELMEIGYNLVVGVRLMLAINKFRPDFIYERYNLYQPTGVILSKLLKIPLVLEVNAPLQKERHCKSRLAMPQFAASVERFTWRNATKVLPVSRALASHLKCAGVLEQNIEVIHNGVYKEMYDDNNTLNKDEEVITIGFIGFAHLTSGLDMVLNAMSKAKNQNVHFVCIGESQSAKELESQVEKIGLAGGKVTFMGTIERSEAMEVVKTFNVAVLPDVIDYASPLKIFEYMATKCLIVAPRKNNILEILDDSCAMLFDDGEFESTLVNTIDNWPALRNKGELAYNRISDGGFLWETNANRIVAIGLGSLKT
jgi:glycosyltransferase involved in cell wall biosynthesis